VRLRALVGGHRRLRASGRRRGAQRSGASRRKLAEALGPGRRRSSPASRRGARVEQRAAAAPARARPHRPGQVLGRRASSVRCSAATGTGSNVRRPQPRPHPSSSTSCRAERRTDAPARPRSLPCARARAAARARWTSRPSRNHNRGRRGPKPRRPRSRPPAKETLASWSPNASRVAPPPVPGEPRPPVLLGVGRRAPSSANALVAPARPRRTRGASSTTGCQYCGRPGSALRRAKPAEGAARPGPPAGPPARGRAPRARPEVHAQPARPSRRARRRRGRRTRPAAPPVRPRSRAAPAHRGARASATKAHGAPLAGRQRPHRDDQARAPADGVDDAPVEALERRAVRPARGSPQGGSAPRADDTRCTSPSRRPRVTYLVGAQGRDPDPAPRIRSRGALGDHDGRGVRVPARGSPGRRTSRPRAAPRSPAQRAAPDRRPPASSRPIRQVPTGW